MDQGNSKAFMTRSTLHPMHLHPSVRQLRHSPGPRTAARPLHHQWSNLRLMEARKIRRRKADFSVASLPSYQTLFLDTPNRFLARLRCKIIIAVVGYLYALYSSLDSCFLASPTFLAAFIKSSWLTYSRSSRIANMPASVTIFRRSAPLKPSASFTTDS